MKRILLALLVAGALLAAGCISQPGEAAAGSGKMADKSGEAMVKDGGQAPNKSGSMAGGTAAGNGSGAMMPKKDEGAAMGEKKDSAGEGAMMGKPASYAPYDAAAYQKARLEGKVVYLEFYASWCPTCRAYEPRLQEAFARMASDRKYDGIAGFKVDYDTQEDLKREFGIAGQHTHVIIGKGGSVTVKSREEWSADDLISELEQEL